VEIAVALLCEADVSRRAVLGAAGALFAWSFMPRFALAGSRDMRLVCIVLRGALDGLSAVPPVGDPSYAKLREEIALGLDGPQPALPLDGFFALHPAMPNFARLSRSGQALVVHAVATAYRERSHFDGQDVLESGQPGPGRVESGWLNRLLGALPVGERIAAKGALGVGAVAPLIVRGSAPVFGWAPPLLPPLSQQGGAGLMDRVLDLYRERDPLLAEALARGLETERIATRAVSPMRDGRGGIAAMQRVAEGAARLIAAEEGPRIGALAFDGWDTHAREGAATGQLALLLGGLDTALAAFEIELGARWKDTVVLVITEFGRTAQVNGSAGTDHGTGTIVLLAGGAVRGGRVLADWPGLEPRDLYEGRDLKPTTDLRAVAKGLMADLFGVSPAVLAKTVFPESAGIAPFKDLVV